MMWDLHDYRLITVSAYPGLMGPLASHTSCVGILSGDSDDRRKPAKVAARSLEDVDGVRRRWRFGDVARLADFVPRLLADSGPDPRPLLVVPPRVSPAWEKAAASWNRDIRVIGRPASQVSGIAEDKVFVREQLRALGVPVPRFEAIATAELSFARVADALGLPFVLQKPNGAGGQGTYLVRDETQLLQAICDNPEIAHWLASGYAGDVTVSVSGVIYEDGVRIMPASLQASNIAELGVGFGDYCGSDFGAVSELRQLTDIYGYAEKAAWWLHGYGHRGLFGADVAVSADGIAFLEINPRVLGSSWLLSKLQQRQGFSPVLEQHVLALLGHPCPVDETFQCGPGSAIILRWRGRAGVVREAPPQDDQVSAVPRLNTVVMPGAIMARIEADQSLTEASGTALRPAAAKLVADLWNAFEVSDYEESGR